ncbi:MAG: hypothetical protein ACTTIQ_04790 [Peptostreptococcus stomatis]
MINFYKSMITGIKERGEIDEILIAISGILESTLNTGIPAALKLQSDNCIHETRDCVDKIKDRLNESIELLDAIKYED